jgi:hypothetical protein
MIEPIAQLIQKIYTNNIGVSLHITAIAATTSSQYSEILFIIYHVPIGVAIFVNIAGIKIASIILISSFNLKQLQNIRN